MPDHYPHRDVTMKQSKLSPRQRQFCREYIVDLNATQAAIRAGYSKKTAGPMAARLLSKVNIQQDIARLMQERGDRTTFDADWVLKHNAAIVTADVTDILEPDGRFKPVHTWPLIWRQIVSGFDIKRLKKAQADGDDEAEQHMKVRFVDKLKALELMGKHNDIAAYAERHKHEHSITADDFVLRKAQEREQRRSSVH